MTIYFKILLFFLLLPIACHFINTLNVFPVGTTPMSDSDLATAYSIRGNSTGEQLLSVLLGQNITTYITVALGTVFVAAALIYNDLRPVVIVAVFAVMNHMFLTSKTFLDNIVGAQNNASLTALSLMLGAALTFLGLITVIEWYLGRAPSDD